MYFFNPLIIAVICVLYFNFLGKLGFELPEKLFSTYTMLFGTLLLPYSKWLWSEPLSALLILSSFYCLYCSIEGEFRKYNFLNFLFLGLLCLNGPVFNILFLTMFLFVFYYFYFLDKNFQNNKILFIDASIIFCICSSLVLYYNYSRYGDIFNMGFSSIRLEDHDNSRYAGTFNRPVLEGLYSLFFSIGKGIMIYSPITFLLPFVFIFFYHQIKARISYCLCTLMVSYILLLILYSKWGIGVWAWGTRYMLPFFPALHLLFPFLLINAKKANPLTKSFLLIVVFWAIGINAFEFIGAWPHFQYDTFFKTETPYSFGMYLPWLSPLFNNWSNWWPNGLIRLIQFVSVAWTTFYIVVIWYQKKFPTA